MTGELNSSENTNHPNQTDRGEPQERTTEAPRPPWKRVLRHTGVVAAVVAVAAISAGGLVGYAVGRRGGEATAEEPAAEQKATTWYCSMHPYITSPKPGKCSICFMDLIPMPDEVDPGPRRLRMSTAAMALAEIQTTTVKRQPVHRHIRMVGKVDYNESRVIDISARMPGRLDKLYVDYTGITVREGDHLVWMYSPELVIAQKELLQAYQAAQRETSPRNREMVLSTLKSSEEKLRLWGLLPEQIEKIKQQGAPADHMTIYAPAGGIVIQKHANEGAYVQEGTKIYTIADLSQVWVFLDAYESDVPWLRFGQKVEFTTESYPGEIFPGRITFIDPVLNEKTRTVKVRVNVPNKDLRLKPGMFVRAVVESEAAYGGAVVDPNLAGKYICPMHPEQISDSPGKCKICGMDLEPVEKLRFRIADASPEPPLVIPATAPLITGKRAVVYLRINPMVFESDHVLDWQALVAKLRKQGTGPEPTPGKRIWGLLPDDLRRQLAGLASPPVVEQPVRNRILQELNALLDRRDFYVPESWSQVELPEDITGLTVESIPRHTERELQLINRRLIESGFPDEIIPAVNQPLFEGREVVLGPRAGDHYIVRYGLSEGQKVVTKGNFKIDSAIQIKPEGISMMTPPTRLAEGAEPGGEGKQSAQAGPQKLDVPAEFRVALDPLYRAYVATATALAQDDLTKARESVQGVIEAAKRIDASNLSDDKEQPVRQRWEQLRNRLVFAAYGVADSRDRAAARQHFNDLSEAAIVLVQGFGHAMTDPVYEVHCPMAFEGKGADWLQTADETANPYYGADMLRCGSRVATFESQAPLTVPDEFRRQLGPVYAAYLKVHEALADDRLADAKTAWQQLRGALPQVDTSALSGRGKEAWQATRKELEQSLASGDAASDVGELRKSFEGLSKTMLAMADVFGHAGDAPLYKAFCPMAFNNKGAPWLQAGTSIANPYFGHTMFDCGSIQRTFAPGAPGAGEGGK